VGQLQTGHLSTVCDSVQGTAAGIRQTALVCLRSREALRHGHQSSPGDLQQARAQEGLCCVREGFGLFARGLVGTAGRVDRAHQSAGRRQDLLLRAAGASERDQGATALSATRYGTRDPVNLAGGTAERARLPAYVSHEEDQS